MSKKTETAERPFASSQYPTLEDYLGAVRKVLQSRKDLSANWIEELISGDDIFLRSCFEKREHPASAAFEIFITEEESAREPVRADHRLKLDVSPWQSQCRPIGVTTPRAAPITKNGVDRYSDGRNQGGLRIRSAWLWHRRYAFGSRGASVFPQAQRLSGL